MIYLAEKLKELRIKKGISQEKLANYLNVSFQAVSKWENSNTYPDIMLLPEIARFFGITVDELLQVEKIDEDKLYKEYEDKACELYLNGNREEELTVWKEAYHKMPNNLAVKEMLMSGYFDVDKIKYKQEIIDLGIEIYNYTLRPDAGEDDAYYRGQAIEEIAKTYAVNGDITSAEKWATKASYLMHAQEFIFSEFTKGNDLLNYFRFANNWYFKNLIYMAFRVNSDDELSKDGYGQELFITLTKLYELVYPNGDMEFEMLRLMCILHRGIAEDEAKGKKCEDIIRTNLEKAVWYGEKSVNVKGHKLEHPLVKGIQIYDAPSNNKQIVNTLREELEWDCFKEYSNNDWFIDIKNKLK